MKFLCLAFGDGKDWVALPEERREQLLAQDEVLRRRGDTVAVVGPPVTVRAWSGEPSTVDDSFTRSDAPLVGFSVVDAEDLAEAVRLVAGTPCAVAGGAIEVRPILEP